MNTINMLTDAPVMFAAVYVSPIVVTDSQEAFRELTRCAERYALEFTGVLPGEIPGVQEARQFFRAIGIDPTKRRLSSEALLLRSIKRKGIDPVNNLVDVGNWCSLEFLLPTCIYDVSKIVGDICLCLGQPHASYLALNGREMNFHGRLVLTDEIGAFGSPMTDSQRTAVSTSTTAALLGIWAPALFQRSTLLENAQTFASRVRKFCGGEIDWIDLLPHSTSQNN